MEDQRDHLVQGLKDLPALPLDDATARRVHRRARAALARRAGATPNALIAAVVSSAVAGYLVWAVQFLAALAR